LAQLNILWKGAENVQTLRVAGAAQFSNSSFWELTDKLLSYENEGAVE
jgi:hypothetical protein